MLLTKRLQKVPLIWGKINSLWALQGAATSLHSWAFGKLWAEMCWGIMSCREEVHKEIGQKISPLPFLDRTISLGKPWEQSPLDSSGVSELLGVFWSNAGWDNAQVAEGCHAAPWRLWAPCGASYSYSPMPGCAYSSLGARVAVTA